MIEMEIGDETTNKDIVDENEAYRLVAELVAKEYRKLRSRDPSSSLLRFIHNVTERGFDFVDDKKTREEFLATYARRGTEATAESLVEYYVELTNAVDKLSGKKIPLMERLRFGKSPDEDEIFYG